MAAPAAAGSGGSYWLGPSFNGLPLTATIDRGLAAYVYGDCTPHSDTGCTPPLEAQNWTTCDRNPLALDVLPTRLFRVRGGGIAAQYREEGVDVGIGRRTVAVFAGDEGLAIAAARLLRLRSASAPPARFRRPAYPRAVLAELARVVAPRRKHHSVRAIARATGLSRAAVRVRLRIAGMLGRRGLRGVRAPSRSWRSVKHDRQVAFWAQELGERDAARHFHLTGVLVRRTLRRVRGLAGRC